MTQLWVDPSPGDPEWLSNVHLQPRVRGRVARDEPASAFAGHSVDAQRGTCDRTRGLCYPTSLVRRCLQQSLKQNKNRLCSNCTVCTVQYGLQRTAIAIYTLFHTQLHIGTNIGHYSRAQPIAMISYYRQIQFKLLYHSDINQFLKIFLTSKVFLEFIL